MRIKSQKDFFAGLMFTVAGIAFAWGATNYNIGEGARMGPGYFPLVLGILLGVLGLIITFTALVVETEDGEKVGAIAWRPLGFIIGANVIFGLLLAGYPKLGMPAFGLVVAIASLVAVASMADASHKLSEIWLGGIIGLAMGVLVVAVLARYLVAALEPGAQTATSMASSSPQLLKAWTYAANLLGRVGGFLLLAYPFLRFAPLPRGTKEYALLTTILICLSVWSFVNLLNLQFPVWPTFITG